MSLRDDVCFSVSATTRAPRPGEVDGKDYFFVTRTAFDAMVAADELLEHAEYVGNCYGTPKSYVERRCAEGMHVLLDIDVQGVHQISENRPGRNSRVHDAAVPGGAGAPSARPPHGR